MSLVFAGIAPHPPLLVPGIGKGEIAKVEKTKLALEQLEQDLYLAKPEVVMIISPHGSFFKDAFCINANVNFKSDFGQFGDMETTMTWKGADFLAAQISHTLSEKAVPIQMVSNEKLDHGSSVPLFYLTQHLPDVKILPIGYSMLDNKSHLNFGELLKEAIMESGKRVAVIASGDLSHGLTTDAPAGLSKVGKEFDEKIIELLQTRNTVGYTSLDEKFVEESSQCGYRSFLILLGILKDMDYSFKNYSYEGPFGVGYLVGNFIF